MQPSSTFNRALDRAFSALLLTLAAASGACTFAAETELVADTAKLMSAEQRQRLADHHGFLLADHGIDYRVVTARGTGDIVSYGVKKFKAMEVGVSSGTGRGLLLVIDAGQDQVRLEVGLALEGVFTDAFVAYVEQRQMVPFFRAERVADGILATTELIVTRAQEAKRRQAFDAPAGTTGSAGGGATAKAKIGAGAEPAAAPGGPVAAAGSSPEETLQAYFAAMAGRDERADLPIYSAASQRMLKGWVVTPAQMDNVVRSYRRCRTDRSQANRSGDRAVIRYRVSDRACAPWFFRIEGGRWRLDLTLMQGAIRFGRSNAWRFADKPPADYAFAFGDWDFDRNGFPKARKDQAEDYRPVSGSLCNAVEPAGRGASACHRRR